MDRQTTDGRQAHRYPFGRGNKNSHCDLDLDPIMLKRKLVRGIVIPNTCVKLYRNWIRNKVARAMTKGEHTNERTYIRTYGILLCEGIISMVFTVTHQVYNKKMIITFTIAQAKYLPLSPGAYVVKMGSREHDC